MKRHTRTNVFFMDVKSAVMMAQSIKCGQNWLLGPYQGTGVGGAGAGTGAVVGAGVLIVGTVGIDQSHACSLLHHPLGYIGVVG